MLNEIQKQIIETWLAFCIDDIKTAPPIMVLQAIRCVLDDELYLEIKGDLEKEPGQLFSVDVLRKVFAHPCPQNRLATEGTVKEGYVFWKESNGIEHSEPVGILGLTSRNEPGQIISKQDIVEFITQLLNQEIKKAEKCVKELFLQREAVEFAIQNDLRMAMNLDHQSLFAQYISLRKSFEVLKEEKQAAEAIIQQLHRQLHDMRELLGFRESKCVTMDIDGSVYGGKYKDGKRHGEGSCIYADGSKYEGNWEENMRNGKGRFYSAIDGCTYEGEWKNDLRHGFGILLYPNQRGKYEGQWKNDKRNGYGIREWPDGSVYAGNYKDDKAEGNGKLTWKDGTQFIGTWKENKRDGHGIEINVNGDASHQHFKNGLRTNGIGTTVICKP